MNTKQIDKLMNVLLGISGGLILTGIIFRLQHWPNGNLILWTGFIANIVLSNFEISRLKKIIKESV
jgi:hypothetical protein